MKKLTNDTDKDLEYYYKMRDIYLNTERQFLEFNEWVPIETNEWSINSPRLYSILITTCGQVEAFLKKICEKIDEVPEYPKFPEYFKKLNQHGMLGIQNVTVYIMGINFNPFNEKDSEHFW